MLEDILRLSDRELGRLMTALVRGALGEDAGISEIRRAGLLEDPELVRSWLLEAAEALGSTDDMVAAIRLIRADRGRIDRQEPPPELILSGPGTEDTPSRDTRVVVREIFESAKKSVLIVGYAFFGSDQIFEPLALRMGFDSDLSARLIVNIFPDRGCAPEQAIRRYASGFTRSSWPFHPRPDVYYLPASLEPGADRRSSVHAKLIVADREDVYLGSANFTTAAFRRNIEAGLRLRDAKLGNQLADHFDRMIRDGRVEPLPLD